jgi:hypothetical protein
MKTCGKNISIVLGLLIFVVFGSVAAFADPILNIETPVAPVNVGGTFDVFINVTDAVDLYAFQFDITFDPAILSAQSVAEGPFLPSGGSTFFIPGTIDNSTGSITFTANTLLGAVSGINDGGRLAELEFQAIGQGTSPITLSNVLLLDSNFSEISFSTTDGSIRVDNPNPTPEPATMLLMAFGSGIMGGGIRRLRKKFKK